MNYINNWITTLTAPLSDTDTVLPIDPVSASRLDLAGAYRLTLVNSLNPLEQTQIEIVDVSAGLALSRAKEGTVAQSWPAGTVVYCAITAGQLTDLQSRIVALENGGGVADGALTDESGNTLTDENSNILIGE